MAVSICLNTTQNTDFKCLNSFVIDSDYHVPVLQVKNKLDSTSDNIIKCQWHIAILTPSVSVWIYLLI